MEKYEPTNKYESTRKDYNRGVEWHEKKTLSYDWSRQINEFVKILKGKRVLDVGCGVGRDISVFLRKGIEIEGFDYSEEAIKKCQAKYPTVSFHIGNFQETNFPDNSFDGIWACASILNTSKEDLPNLLNEFLRILKPGGIIFASVKEGFEEKMVPDEYGERFFSFFSDDELKSFFENAGFKTIGSETITDEDLTGVASKKANWIIIYSEKSY